MYDVAILVDHYVAIVAILDLQQIPNQRVGGHGLDKVGPGCLELLGALVAILMLEILGQAAVRLPAELVPRLGIGHALDDAALEGGEGFRV